MIMKNPNMDFVVFARWVFYYIIPKPFIPLGFVSLCPISIFASTVLISERRVSGSYKPE